MVKNEAIEYTVHISCAAPRSSTTCLVENFLVVIFRTVGDAFRFSSFVMQPYSYIEIAGHFLNFLIVHCPNMVKYFLETRRLPIHQAALNSVSCR